MQAPRRRLVLIILAVILAGGPHPGKASDPSTLPRLQITDVQFEGAFRLPADQYGVSSLNFSEGPLAYDAATHSIFIVGHSHHQAIAQFLVPTLVASSNLADLSMADAPVQGFASVLDRTAGGNPQNLDRIGGLLVVPGAQGPELLVNAYEYYDAPADNSLTTLVVRDITNLSTSTVDGFFELQGGAGHTSGWISAIPVEWQAALGGTHLTGHSSGIPIIGRCSVGPSAFAFDPAQIGGASPVPTTELLDFSLNNPLHDDLTNATGENDLWNHLSRVVYGFIAPDTRTYVTLGYSGGHVSGVCYKCTQNDGNLCGGYCAPDAGDYYTHYWLWDVNDLVAVRQGQLQAHEARPYDHGQFVTPYDVTQLGGGAFDPASGLLYLTLQRADDQQGPYANPPVVAAFRVGPAATSTSVPVRFELAPAFPNPSRGSTVLQFVLPQSGHASLRIHDVSGRLVRTLADGRLESGRHRWTWRGRDERGRDVAAGVYFYRLSLGAETTTRKMRIVR